MHYRRRSVRDESQRRESATKEISPTTDDQPSLRRTGGGNPAACPVVVTAEEQGAEVATQLDESEEAGLQTEEGGPGAIAVFSRYWDHVAQLDKIVYTAEGDAGYKPGSSSAITA